MITAIIPCRNDAGLMATVDSLMTGAGHDPALKLVVVDDASHTPVIPVSGHDIVIRNQHSVGPAVSRHKGAQATDTDWLMFCDAHMRFPDGWFKSACGYLEAANPEDVFCSAYRTDKIFNSYWYDSHLIGGADFYWWRHRGLTYSFADLSPRRPQIGCMFDVPCILGACYFVNREWFNSIGGFSKLMGYGSEEVWLSWNSWLAGGTVSCLGDIPVTHLYQERAKGAIGPSSAEQALNRLICLRAILPPGEYADFASWLPITDAVKYAAELVELPVKQAGIDHDTICDAFQLQTLAEAMELMRQYESDTHLTRRCQSCGRAVAEWRQARGNDDEAPPMVVCHNCWVNVRYLNWRVI